MSNELTPPTQPSEPTGTDLTASGPTAVDPTSTIDTGSTMDLPFIEMVPTVAPIQDPAPAPAAADPAAAQTGAPYVGSPAYPAPAYETPAYEPPARVEAPILRGPSPWTVVHGLIALAVAVVVFVTTATTATIDWGKTGPATVVGLGVVLVLLGLLGMRSRRRLGV